MHDETITILSGLDSAERAFLFVGAGWLVFALDVDHPVRSPQPLKAVGSTRMSA
jgi:hypothetical protein